MSVKIQLPLFRGEFEDESVGPDFFVLEVTPGLKEQVRKLHQLLQEDDGIEMIVVRYEHGKNLGFGHFSNLYASDGEFSEPKTYTGPEEINQDGNKYSSSRICLTSSELCFKALDEDTSEAYCSISMKIDNFLSR